jgi:DNA-binding transcriptional LysR family regulator
MNRDWLRSFAAFAEHRSFTAAARQLGLSQPALHVQVAKLGDHLGVPLYARRGRSLELTAAGRRVAAYARDLDRREQALVAELEGRDAPVTLAAGTGALIYLLGEAIRRFDPSRRALRLLPLRGPEAITAVREGRADLAVAAGPARGLRVRRVARVGAVAALPTGHRLTDRKRLTAADLDGEALIVPPAGSPHRERIAAAFAAAGAGFEIAVEAAGWDVMLQLVRLRIGAAIVNDFCAAPGGTAAVDFRGLEPIEYRLSWRGELSDSAARLRDAIASRA